MKIVIIGGIDVVKYCF